MGLFDKVKLHPASLQVTIDKIRKHCEKEGKKVAENIKKSASYDRYPEQTYKGTIEAYYDVIAFIKQGGR